MNSRGQQAGLAKRLGSVTVVCPFPASRWHVGWSKVALGQGSASGPCEPIDEIDRPAFAAPLQRQTYESLLLACHRLVQ